MPPKTAAVPAVEPVQKKEGAKVVYITIPLIGEGEVRLGLNPTARTDIFIDSALTQFVNEFTKRTTATEATLAAAKALAAAAVPAGEGAVPDAAVVEAEELLRRLQTVTKALQSASVNNVELLEVVNGAKVPLASVLSQPASEIVRPSGVYRLMATSEDGTSTSF